MPVRLAMVFITEYRTYCWLASTWLYWQSDFAKVSRRRCPLRVTGVGWHDVISLGADVPPFFPLPVCLSDFPACMRGQQGSVHNRLTSCPPCDACLPTCAGVLLVVQRPTVSTRFSANLGRGCRRLHRTWGCSLSRKKKECWVRLSKYLELLV